MPGTQGKPASSTMPPGTSAGCLHTATALYSFHTACGSASSASWALETHPCVRTSQLEWPGCSRTGSTDQAASPRRLRLSARLGCVRGASSPGSGCCCPELSIRFGHPLAAAAFIALAGTRKGDIPCRQRKITCRPDSCDNTGASQTGELVCRAFGSCVAAVLSCKGRLLGVPESHSSALRRSVL